MFMPDDSYLESLFTKESMEHFAPYTIDNIDHKATQIKAVYHSIPLSVLVNERYRDFMRSFGPQVEHIIDCKEANNEVIGRNKGYSLS